MSQPCEKEGGRGATMTGCSVRCNALSCIPSTGATNPAAAQEPSKRVQPLLKQPLDEIPIDSLSLEQGIHHVMIIFGSLGNHRQSCSNISNVTPIDGSGRYWCKANTMSEIIDQLLSLFCPLCPQLTTLGQFVSVPAESTSLDMFSKMQHTPH